MQAMLTEAKSKVAEAVQNDPTVQAAIAQTVEAIKADMPKMVHDAMMVHFCGQMSQMSSNLAASMFQTNANTQLLAELQTQLNKSGIY